MSQIENFVGSLKKPETLVLNSFRIEELYVSPNKKTAKLTVSSGVDVDGVYTPVKLLGSFELDETHFADIENDINNVVSTLFGKLQEAFNDVEKETNDLDVDKVTEPELV